MLRVFGADCKTRIGAWIPARFPLELFNSFESPSPKRGCVVGDGRFADSFDLRDATIERGNQFEQFTNGLGRAYRHRRPLRDPVMERDAFQISPHCVHRQ